MSIELSLEDVKKVAYHYGFTMEVRVSALNLFWVFGWKGVVDMVYFDMWFAGGENDRNYLHFKHESNDAGNLLIFEVTILLIKGLFGCTPIHLNPHGLEALGCKIN